MGARRSETMYIMVGWGGVGGGHWVEMGQNNDFLQIIASKNSFFEEHKFGSTDFFISFVPFLHKFWKFGFGKVWDKESYP